MSELPVPGMTKISTVNPNDVGALVGAVLEGSHRFFGQTITLNAEEQSEAERLRVWSESKFFATELGTSLKSIQFSEYHRSSNRSRLRNIKGDWHPLCLHTSCRT